MRIGVYNLASRDPRWGHSLALALAPALTQILVRFFRTSSGTTSRSIRAASMMVHQWDV